MKYDVKNLVLFNKNPAGRGGANWGEPFNYGFTKEEMYEIANKSSGGEAEAYIKLVQYLKADWDRIVERNDGYATVSSLKKWVKSFNFDNIELGVGSYDSGTYITVQSVNRKHNHGDYHNIKASMWDLNKFDKDSFIESLVAYARLYEKDYYVKNDPYGKVLGKLVDDAYYISRCSREYGNNIDVGDIIENGNLPPIEELKVMADNLEKVLEQVKANEKSKDECWHKYWEEEKKIDEQIRELERKKKELNKESDDVRNNIISNSTELWQNAKVNIPMFNKN